MGDHRGRRMTGGRAFVGRPLVEIIAQLPMRESGSLSFSPVITPRGGRRWSH